MARRLDILVPIYDEGEIVIKPLLDSIAIQQQVDLSQVGVIVCCDGGSTVLTDEFMAQYPFHIEFHMCEHQGVSATRNTCLDYSKAEYVCWCDCDDMYCDVCAFFLLFHEMDAETSPDDMMRFKLGKPEKGFDMLISNFREQTKGPDGSFTFIDHNTQPDGTFVHGKCFRRQWLIDNDLKFCPSCEIHEDSYMILLCREVAKPWRLKWCPMAFFLWRWRKNSICRRDEKYILKTFNCLVDSNDQLISQFLRRSMHAQAASYMAMLTWDAYYTMNKQEWVSQENTTYRDNVEKRFAEYFRKYKSLWDSIPVQEKMMISQGVRQRSVMEGMLLEALTIDQWIDRILAKW